MKNHPAFVICILITTVFLFETKAQSTFSSVHQILQSHCASSGCHNTADVAAGLDITASSADVYTALLNSVPQNTTAAAKGNKLIAPGYIAESFLYRKIAEGFDPMAQLETAEHGTAHDSLSSLSNVELETIRQWIQYGAPMNDTVVDPQLIHDFHSGSGLPLVNKPLSPEEEGLEGIQLRIGPILMYPGQEDEYFHKFKAGLSSEKEIYRMETYFDSYSHHFVLYNFLPTPAASYPEGVQDAGSYSAQIPIQIGALEIGAWSRSQNNQLPPGTAFFWDTTTNLVMDYHVRNYNTTMVLGAICYINIYTRDKQQTTSEMKMDFPVYGGFNPFVLQIPPTGQPYKVEFALIKPNQTWNIWRMQGHTHLLGTDFDIYLRNADGTRGRQVYEGFYNPEYTFNQGFFDNQHAPVRTTETPFERVDMDNGLILEATYLNNTGDTVGFGLTTKHEMFASYITYTLYKNATSDEAVLDNPEPEIHVQPNPARDFITVQFSDAKPTTRSLRIYSLEGKICFQSPEFTAEAFTMPVQNFPTGVYFIEIMNGDKTMVTKILVE